MRSSIYINLLFILCFGAVLYGCLKAPDYPIEPHIELVNISKTTMQQGTDIEDTTQVTIKFTDGDGDLGEEDSINVFFIDLRQDFVTYPFNLKPIPPEGAANGVSGEFYITLGTSCCIYDNGLPPCEPSEEQPTDTVVYEVYIKDRAGNESNHITLPPITLICD